MSSANQQTIDSVVDHLAGPSTSQPLPPPPLATPDPSAQRMKQLTGMGIKIRDFGYESTLPPVASVRKMRIQTQPRKLQRLKRTRDMGEDSDPEALEVEDESVPKVWYIDSNGTGSKSGTRYRPRAPAQLERTNTEPADDQPMIQAWGARGQIFNRHCPRASSQQRSQSQGARPPATPRRTPTTSAAATAPSGMSPQSQPALNLDSQETESWVDTPLVTPNGSYQVPVQTTTELPLSQLESMLPQLGDPAPEPVTLSQLGFSQLESQPSPGRSQQQPSPARPQRSPQRPQRPLSRIQRASSRLQPYPSSRRVFSPSPAGLSSLRRLPSARTEPNTPSPHRTSAHTSACPAPIPADASPLTQLASCTRAVARAPAVPPAEPQPVAPATGKRKRAKQVANEVAEPPAPRYELRPRAPRPPPPPARSHAAAAKPKPKGKAKAATTTTKAKRTTKAAKEAAPLPPPQPASTERPAKRRKVERAEPPARNMRTRSAAKTA